MSGRRLATRRRTTATTVVDAGGLRRRARLRRPPHPPARARPRGGRDDRDREPGGRARRVHGGGGDAEHRPGARTRATSSTSCADQGERGRAVRRAARRVHHRRPGRRAAGAVRRAGRGRRADVHRRRQRRAGPAADAPGDGVLARPRHGARPALRGRRAHRGRGDARGALLQRARRARLAGDRRGADGPPRHRAVPAHRSARPHPAPVDRGQRRAGPGGQGRRAAGDGRGDAAPLRLTDEALRGYDPVFKVNPPLRTAADIEAIVPGWPTARSTPSPPTTPRTRPTTRSARSTRRRPGWSGWRRRSAWRLAELDMPLADVVAALSWQPAAIAGLADRHGRPIEPAGRPTSSCSTRDAGGRWPGALASRSRNTPYVGRTLRGTGAPHGLPRRAGRASTGWPSDE